MSAQYSRRQAIAMGLGSLASISAFGLAGCSNSPAPTGDPTSVKLQMIFWGSASRDNITKQAIKLFEEKNPAITITSQFTGFDSYWPKLNTMIASDSLPDLVQMDMRYLSEYVRKKLLLDLAPYLYNQTIDLTDFDPMLLASSKINNTVYGVPLGGNYQCMVYNQSLIEQSGMGTPPESMTWDEFGNYSTELTKALGNSTYGTADGSGEIVNFEIWVRQRGKDLYTLDGHLGFDEPILEEWFVYWDKLRQAKSCPPMNIQAGLDTTGTPSDSSVITGKAVFAILYSNQFEVWQKATKQKLGIMIPPTGNTAGMYLKTSQMLSISAKTKHPTESAKFSSFIINDSGAVKALGIERGVPGSLGARALLTPQLTPEQKTMMQYIDVVSKSSHVRTRDVLDPPGAGEVEKILGRVSEAIGFGKTSIQDGVKSFFADAQKALASS